MTRSGAPTWHRRAVVRRARMRAESRHRAARAEPWAVTVACAIDRRDHQASCRDLDAERLGMTPLSFDRVLETRSSESPRARPRVVASGSHGTLICNHHERAGGCVSSVVLHEQRPRHALRRTWCERRMVPFDTDDTWQTTPRPDGRQPRLHALARCRRPHAGAASIA